MEIWKISKDRGLRLHSARALVMPCFLPFWESTSYSAECEVSSSLSYLGFPEPPSDKRKGLHTFFVFNQNFILKSGDAKTRLMYYDEVELSGVEKLFDEYLENRRCYLSKIEKKLIALNKGEKNYLTIDNRIIELSPLMETSLSHHDSEVKVIISDMKQRNHKEEASSNTSSRTDNLKNNKYSPNNPYPPKVNAEKE